MIARLFISLAVVLGLVSTLSAPAYAFDIFGGVDCSQSQTASSAVCKDKDPSSNPVSGNNGLLVKITKLIAELAGMAAVILIVVGGLRYVLSGGDPESVNKSKSTIVNAVVGLAVIALAASIITFVINRLSS